jgi:protein O-mannosyl-transferase
VKNNQWGGGTSPIFFSFKHTISILIFVLFIFSAYSNTFDASWHMDDIPNILNNHYLHIDSLDIKQLSNTLFTNPLNPYELNNKIYRPVPCLSFALNWYFHKDNVTSYHITNILIHLSTCFCLFLFIFNLFKTPNIKNPNENGLFIAFMTSLLWALNPIQTQAVTYIVQRMAQMAAMFYIFSMYAYIKGRIHSFHHKTYLWFTICFISFLFAIGSKENAMMLPLSLILVEITFFQKFAKKKKLFLILTSIAIMLISLSGVFAFMGGNPLAFIETYNSRSFSLVERLLAEPRIVVNYLSQIFFPLPSRFSIAHDVILSRTLLMPWTTIPSIVTIVSLLSYALLRFTKYPLLSFSILFFFINHIIESTIIPLELVFEHRNYLPSFFCFLPLAIIFNKILKYYKNKKQIIYIFTICVVIFVIAFSGISTFIRNKAWKTEITLWSDAAQKAPNSARALEVLAINLAWGNESRHPKKYDMAIKLFEKSLTLHTPSTSHKAEIIANIANVYANNKQNYLKAIELYKKALKINPDHLKTRKDFVTVLILNNNMNEALKNVEILILKNSKNETYHNLKGFILLWQQKYDKAFLSIKNAYKIAPLNRNIMLNTGVILSMKGNYEIAETLLLKLIESSPNNMIIYLYLIENSLKADNSTNAKLYAKKLNRLFNTNKIFEFLNSNKNKFKHPPLSKVPVAEFIKQQLSKEQIDALNYKTIGSN